MVFGGWRGRWWWTGDTVVKGEFTKLSPDTVVNTPFTSKHSLYYSICDTVVKGVFTTHRYCCKGSVYYSICGQCLVLGVERALVVDRGSVY